MPSKLGDRIRSERERYGMTQAELSRRIGLSTTAMNDIEQGRTVDPRVSKVVAIADTLHVSIDTLLDREVSHADA